MKNYERITRRLFSVGMLISACIFVWLALTPSLTTESFFLFYSLQRFILIILTLLVFLILFFGPVFARNEKVIGFVGKLIRSEIAFCLNIISATIFFIIIAGIIVRIYGQKAILFERLLPMIVLGLLFSIELLVFQLVYEERE